MQYRPLEGAGLLSISYTGGNIDVYTLGVIHVNLQDIIDKVSLELLAEEGILDVYWRRSRFPSSKFVSNYSRLVRGEISSLQAGSLYESIQFVIASVISDAGIAAILQNLAASIVWSISASGVSGVYSKFTRPPNNRAPTRSRRLDPFDVGPNIRDMMIAISEARPNQRIELTIRESQLEDREVTIRVDGDD